LTVAQTERLIQAAREQRRGTLEVEAARRTGSGVTTRRSWESALALRDVAIIETAYAAGLRISELASLTIGSVDLKRARSASRQGPQERGSAVGRRPRAH